MEKSSLWHFLMIRFGTQCGILLGVLAGFYYENHNTVQEDFFIVTTLQECRQLMGQAARSSSRFLQSGKSQDLDEYNETLTAVGTRFSTLSQSLKGLPEQRQRLLEIQKKSRQYFLTTNDRLEKQGRGSERAQERGLASNPNAEEIGALIEAMRMDIQKNSSHSLNIGGLTFPVALWMSLFLGASSCALLLASHRLKSKALKKQKKNISDLKIQSILLDGILNSISEGLIVIDENGRFTRYNIAAQRIIGTRLKSISTEEEAREFGFFDVHELNLMTLTQLPFARALRGEAVDDLEILVHNEAHPEGIYISASSRYLNDIDGSIRGALVVFKDITKRKATEQEWLMARESALENARKKSDFLAAMSHEIRTPMNGVIGMTTLLAETPLDAEQKDYVGTIKRSAEALLRLINDILDHSKIEAGKIQFHPRPFDLKFMCEDILELFSPTVREKNILLESLFEGRKDWYFIGDPERLRQILVNLIGNAVKFTEKGRVLLKVENLETLSDKGRLKFSVTDTGTGLSEEESQMLFQKYSQTKAGIKYGGTGLGLSICRQLVELMGGQIGVQSKLGLGSTFWFTVELPVATVAQLPVQREAHFASLFCGRVLLAEDQPVNQRVAVAYLEKLGLQVDVAVNGQVAVEKAMKSSYDLIFMDCQMPVMTGYEATQKIRAAQATGAEKGEEKKTPIVALTAEGTSGERSTCFAVGMDDFLTKPLELDPLVRVLHRWLKSSSSPVLDLSALEKLKTYMVNDKSLTQALIEDFMQSAPALVQNMKAAFRQKALKELQNAAHALKSSSATLGAQALSAICQKLEDLENLEAAEALLTELETQFTQSQRELQKYLTQAAA